MQVGGQNKYSFESFGRMIVTIYDLAGRLRRFHFNLDDERLLSVEAQSGLLVSPTDKNRVPYIQNAEKPVIRDFLDDNGVFCEKEAKKKTILLNDFFCEECVTENQRNKAKLINRCFSAIRGGNEKNETKNIILVPDNFSAKTQEIILRNCRLGRSSTTLLWRSVAACLGAEEEIKRLGLKAEDKVCVVDSQDGYLDWTVLTLKKDRGYLIPQRKAYRVAYRERLASHKMMNHRAVYVDKNGQESSFYNYTHYGKEGNCIILNGGDFERKEFRKKTERRLLGHSLPVKAYLVLGDGVIIDRNHNQAIIHNKNKDFAAIGAARYASRLEKGLPTYFDQCEGLSIIVQDEREQLILSKTLIPKKDDCPGGKVLIGNINRDCIISKEDRNIKFYLFEGIPNRNDPLKFFEQELKEIEIFEDEEVELSPSVIPGQGIAKVIAKSRVFKEDVGLDFVGNAGH